MQVHSPLMAPTTGMQLRLEVVASGLTYSQVSGAMGVHRNTLRAILKDPIVDPERAAQVRDAIARLATRKVA